MASVDELADEILAAELDEHLETPLEQILDAAPYVTTVLQAIEQWLEQNDDARGARLVGQCAIRMATHEAETS